MKNKFNIETTGTVGQITVKNILTKHSLLFVNENSLTENIISYIIIHHKNSTSNLLNNDLRSRVKDEAKITESVSKITGRKFAFSETFDLHATKKDL